MLIISLLIISGCKDDNPYTGQTVSEPSDNLLNLKINSVERSNTISFYNAENQAEKGYTYLILDVTIENPQKVTFNFNPFLTKVVDKEGYSYDYDVSSYELNPYFDSTQIYSQKSASGKLSYAIPKNSKELTFVIENYNRRVLAKVKLPS